MKSLHRNVDGSVKVKTFVDIYLLDSNPEFILKLIGDLTLNKTKTILC